MSSLAKPRKVTLAAVLIGVAILLGATCKQTHAQSFAGVIDGVQPKIVKIYGAGGIRGLEAYQSGFLISSEGHILTVWSYVLDTDFITATLNDGQRFQAELVGIDPRFEIAVLKIDADQLPFFNLNETTPLDAGDRVLAFSNLFSVAAGDEAASVQHGSVSIKTQLSARRGAFETPYSGPVYVLDAMTNNPGAAGGVVTDRQGHLAGLLGKELRNSLNNTWLNYAVPTDVLVEPVEDILAGKSRPRTVDDTTQKPAEPWTPVLLGIRLVPDILAKTPPFVDYVRADSPAERAGLQADDLILFVNDRVAASCNVVEEELSFVDRIDPVRLMVQRGQQLLDVELQPAP